VGVWESVPTLVLLEELNMTPVEDAWMRGVVQYYYWNSLASLPIGRLAHGDFYLGVNTRLALS
jgi:hypothetical protein